MCEMENKKQMDLLWGPLACSVLLPLHWILISSWLTPCLVLPSRFISVLTVLSMASHPALWDPNPWKAPLRSVVNSSLLQRNAFNLVDALRTELTEQNVWHLGWSSQSTTAAVGTTTKTTAKAKAIRTTTTTSIMLSWRQQAPRSPAPPPATTTFTRNRHKDAERAWVLRLCHLCVCEMDMCISVYTAPGQELFRLEGYLKRRHFESWSSTC